MVWITRRLEGRKTSPVFIPFMRPEIGITSVDTSGIGRVLPIEGHVVQHEIGVFSSQQGLDVCVLSGWGAVCWVGA